MDVLAKYGDIVDQILKAEDTRSQFPMISMQTDDIDLERAYLIQYRFAEKKEEVGHVLSGYKAACTSEFQQVTFHVPEPVTGHIFMDGYIRDNIVWEERAGIKIETEVVYILNRDIDEPVKSIEELRGCIKAIYGGVEFPLIDYIDNTKSTAYDVISNDAGGYKYIIGDEIKDWDHMDEMEVVLYMDGKELFRGVGSDASGSQWGNLYWFVNSLIVDHGVHLKKDMILFSGSVGKLAPALPGDYTVTFGDTVIIDFSVKTMDEK